ncbi:MAG: prepilin-type N-terminal cleavage/methylation domain-containing protein [Verrucomicrobia bacterium]|nr:prepilin-type N-terminal cleavage/methylation domain-containing protein [Verrucomicrobiota bacterium]
MNLPQGVILSGAKNPAGSTPAGALLDSSLPLRMTNRGPLRRRQQRARAFTLVELIVVMVLLLIVASMVAPRMSSFFRGRALSAEGRRMLSLINYGQSRAVAEGVPVLLWIDAGSSTYGLEIQAGFAGSDERAVTYTAEPTLTLETPTVAAEQASELDDEKLGLPEDLAVIRFNPDGFFDDVSVSRIVIRQGDEGALELVPAANRLRYEIRPVTIAN